ncbi:hypothetical protein VNO77_01434 [Canavalia gladiata]|uniref:Uncharacterized protein n=1 Tax=Canavalia gladiata TaxID=3824 RepID=A0AAN9MRE2_CANGL
MIASEYSFLGKKGKVSMCLERHHMTPQSTFKATRYPVTSASNVSLKHVGRVSKHVFIWQEYKCQPDYLKSKRMVQFSLCKFIPKDYKIF